MIRGGCELFLDQLVSLFLVSIHTFPLVFGRHLSQLHPGQFPVNSPRIPNVVCLLFQQVDLLRPQNRPRPGDPDPPNKRRCRELEMFHGVAADQGPGPSEASLAVDRNYPAL